MWFFRHSGEDGLVPSNLCVVLVKWTFNSLGSAEIGLGLELIIRCIICQSSFGFFAVNDRKGKESQRSNQGCKETTCRKLRHPCLFVLCTTKKNCNKRPKCCSFYFVLLKHTYKPKQVKKLSLITSWVSVWTQSSYTSVALRYLGCST